MYVIDLFAAKSSRLISLYLYPARNGSELIPAMHLRYAGGRRRESHKTKPGHS
jgi:hypothetical protein